MVYFGEVRHQPLSTIETVSQLDPTTGENMRARIWIGGLPHSVKEEEILPHFTHYGTIKWCKVYPHRKGAFAFMQFEYAEHASSVLKEMNLAQIFESGYITVKRAKMEVTKEQAAADEAAASKAAQFDMLEMQKHRDRESERLQVLANTKALEEERVAHSNMIRKANEKKIRKEQLGLDTSSEEERENEEEKKQVEENLKGDEVKKSKSKSRKKSRSRGRRSRSRRGDRKRSRSRRGDRKKSRSRRGDRKKSRSRRGDRKRSSSRKKSSSREYFVSLQNLPSDMTKDELKEFAGKFIKSIRDVRVFKSLDDIHTGTLEVRDKEDIEKLKKEVDGHRVKGCPDRLKVVEGNLYKE